MFDLLFFFNAIIISVGTSVIISDLFILHVLFLNKSIGKGVKLCVTFLKGTIETKCRRFMHDQSLNRCHLFFFETWRSFT